MMTNVDVEIRLIKTEKELQAVSDTLKKKTAIGFDTEFDRFRREYGFKLSLLQIYDGEICYLIDPISIKDLSSLWPVFENPAIRKVAYSCSEDIQILKVNGCFPKNIYDIQVVAKLCNHPSNSYSDVLLEELGIVSDKSLQKSNWRKRPLADDQLIYASNDVIPLLKLQDIFSAVAEKNGVSAFIEEDNAACEAIPIADFTVKLTSRQKGTYSTYHQKALLDLFNIRNGIAMEYNMPPANICSDSVLEEILDNREGFVKAPFARGFCRRILEDESNMQKFQNFIGAVDPKIPVRQQRERALSDSTERSVYERSEKVPDSKYGLLSDYVSARYGKIAGEYILRGFKKTIGSRNGAASGLRNYQKKIIKEACKALDIEFK
ncbi:MAG: ribonuclease D [Ferruginibacter sp.]